MRSFERLTSVGALLIFLTSAGCIKDKKREAGEGISRLAVRNMGAMVSLLKNDTVCGFASDAVKNAAVITGNPGEFGTAVLTVTGCVIDAGAGVVTDTDCSGDTTTASGSFTADATLTITGLITGDIDSPSVPDSPESVVFDLQSILPQDFEVVASNNENSLVNSSGTLSAIVTPRLAVAASSGACAIATKNVTFTDIAYSTDAIVVVNTADDSTEVEIGGALFSAQNGIDAAGVENNISGTMTVRGLEVDVTGDGALDPEYDAVAFKADYECTTDLAIPESFLCADVRANLAFGSARLSALTLGIAAGVARADTTCGFSSANVIPSLVGAVGDDGSTLTLTLNNDCTITLPQNTVVSTDCNGEDITVGGSYTVQSGSTLEVTGYNVGNALVGVLPTSRAPALITADIAFNEFNISKTTATATLTIHSGSLAGTISPRFFLDTTSGACSVSSPILGTAPVAFGGITWTNGDVTLDNDNTDTNPDPFNFTLNTSSIAAQSGDNVATTNEINGSITFSGAAIAIPAGTELEEDFIQQVFDDAFQSCAAGIPDTAIPVADAACSFRQTLGQTAARLLVGATAGAISASNTAFCAATTVNVINGAPNTTGNVVSTTTNCVFNVPAIAPGTTDCLGSTIEVQGDVTADGVKTTNALLGDLNVDGIIETIAPNAQNAVLFDGVALTFADWSFDKQAGGVSLARMTLSGDVTVGNFTPILGQGDGNAIVPADGVGDVLLGSPVFNRTTPIFSFTDLALANGTATLVLRNAQNLVLTFNIDLSGLDLDVFVGAAAGVNNDIAGALTVDTELVTIVAGTPFDAAFTQANLDASYSCVNIDADQTNNVILVPAQ